MDDDLRLAMYRGSSARIISIGEYLTLAPAERAAAAVSPSWCTLSLIVAGDDRWGAHLSLGALGVLVAQLPQAASRVEHGRLAVIRAAVFDVPDALCVLFEPRGDEVLASIAMSDELSDPSWMPGGARAEALYAFIEQHRDRLVAAAAAEGVAPQSIDRAALRAALEREFALGTEAVALLGPGGS